MTDATTHPSTAATTPASRTSWSILAVVAVCQLMIVLDSSIVTIALPQAQESLGISDADRQWVITAYTLGFGGLLLLGGRLSDYLGRRRMFVVGLLGFAAASVIGGLAPSEGVLFAARGLQGSFAALMAPAALSILATTYTEPGDRAKAFSAYGGISGGGAAIGLILGGLLTEYASWRWCLLVNAPIALVTVIFAVRVIGRSALRTERDGYDIGGAAAVTLGLIALVYGFSEAAKDGWGSGATLVSLAAGVVLLVAFVLHEGRARRPLLPLRIPVDRNRGGAFLAALLSAMGLYGMFLFLTYYLQGTLGYSALQTGFAFLPFSAGILVGAALTNRLLAKVGPRNLLAPGLAMAAVGLLWFTQNALLNTIAATATTSYLASHHQQGAAGLVHGYRVAFLIAALILAIGAIASFLLIHAGPDDLPAAEPQTS